MEDMEFTLAAATDALFSHNEIIALWTHEEGEDGHYDQMFWRGEAWKLPERMKYLSIDKFFGTIPERVSESDTLNIRIRKDGYACKYKEEWREDFMKGDGHKDDNVHEVQSAREATPGYAYFSEV